MGISTPLKNFEDEAIRIVSEAANRGITLRIMGALVVRLHCKKFLYLHNLLRRELTDIDLVTYSKYKGKLVTFFKELGYEPDERVLSFYGTFRHKYIDRENDRVVDVFFDKLEMCHTISFKGRLELDFPTITLSDFLLEKLQIIKITEKDLKDLIVILREHEVDIHENDRINGKYIAKILANDWGFYYTVMTNLKKTGDFVLTAKGIKATDKQDIQAKIDKLLKLIENEPKTPKWKIRKSIGTKKKWYREVEDFGTTYKL